MLCGRGLPGAWRIIVSMTKIENSNQAISTELLNKLRASVLGANDGVVSISSLLMGVAGATNDQNAVFTAGLAALVAGALSMAVGEYVSVSSQSDAEKAYIKRERELLRDDPDGQFEGLVQAYVNKGINAETARQVATELTEGDALRAHLIAEFGVVESDVVNPVHAASSSFMAFTLGGLIPFVTMLLAPAEYKIFATGTAVVLALCATGYLSATVGGASRRRAMVRVVAGGAIAMVATYYVGALFGAQVL